MPTATEETLKKLIPEEYHDYLDVFDPEGPTRKLPPLRPGYDFEIKLDPTKAAPQTGQTLPHEPCGARGLDKVARYHACGGTDRTSSC
jgi:hypothetical protein